MTRRARGQMGYRNGVWTSEWKKGNSTGRSPRFKRDESLGDRVESATPLPYVGDGGVRKLRDASHGAAADPHERDLYAKVAGVRRGKLVVLGWAKDVPRGERGRWVAVCDCGVYVHRRTKSMLNEKNTRDACDKCSKEASALWKASQCPEPPKATP